MIAAPVSPRRVSRLNAWILAVLLAFAALAQLVEVSPEAVRVAGLRVPDVCLFKRVWGRPCLGCGLSRSVLAALQGHRALSRATHPSGRWVAGYLALQAAARLALLRARPPSLARGTVDLVVSGVGLLAAIYLPLLLRGPA